jgi:hypothetical protein
VLHYDGLVDADVDIQIFDMGFGAIPAGINSVLVQNAFAAAIRDLGQQVEDGTYLNGQPLELIHPLPPGFLSSCFGLEISKGHWKNSCVLMRGLRGKFVNGLMVPGTTCCVVRGPLSYLTS